MSTVSIINPPDYSERFWQLVKKIFGEVCAFSLCRYIPNATISTLNRRKAFYWGIYFFTEQGAFFHHFQQNNIMLNFLKKEDSNEFCLQFLFEDIHTWKTLTQKKVFKKNDVYIALNARASFSTLTTATIPTKEPINTSEQTTHLFVYDFLGKDILQALRQRIGDKEIDHES